ncbi:hypothetical protein M501DRAFT_1012859 [Patellaria atrata CBS 101060]|uniref:DUF1989 domain-containing protein n=1 Tax=Patellaria atrata CBS 101060 TaxID=1346257 RepID=A0A9P4SJP2_9PEZI|nr:hypothetical protein M501DRAFT_1012859 [Patellaria atrata CBS 101060]
MSAVSQSAFPLPRTRDPPVPAYIENEGSPLRSSPEIYTAIGSAPRKLVHAYTIPPRSSHAWQVSKTQILRLSTPEGPQVGDLNLWNQHNPKERFWASRTRQLHGTHVSTGDRLWSCLPYMRAMVTIIGDSLASDEEGSWGVRGTDGKRRTKWGGGCHDLLGTRCDPYVNKLLTGDTYNFHCHSNLFRAISVAPYNLSESDIHDVINVFQVTGLDAHGKYFMEPSPAVPGSYIEFFAEQDLLCALSTCPGGDLSAWGWAEGTGGRMGDTCRPIKLEVFEIEAENKDSILQGWIGMDPSDYTGNHGQ